DIAALNAIADIARRRTGYLPQFGSDTGLTSTLVLVNYGNSSQTVSLAAGITDLKGKTDGSLSVQTVKQTLAPNQRIEARLDQLFGFNTQKSIAGYVSFDTQSEGGLYAYLESKTRDGMLTAITPREQGYSDISFSQLSNGVDFYTGLTLVNAGSQTSSITIDAFNPDGSLSDTAPISLASNSRWTGFLSDLLSGTQDQIAGRIHITASSPILASEIVGSISTGALGVVPPEGSVLSTQASGDNVSTPYGGTVISADG